MLCGADELGLSDERIGLMELPDSIRIGADFAEISASDDLIEVDLTPNRGVTYLSRVWHGNLAF